MEKLKQKYNLKYENIVWAKVGRKYLVVLLNKKDIKDSLFTTNKCSIDILDWLLTKKSSEKIINLLSKKYSLSHRRAKTDFLKFIAKLESLKVID
ncbi:MAG: PqqD family peptide modification chaperone [Candidatus Omnitrophota bacterium]